MSNVLITGVPKSGKSTLLERVLDSLSVRKKGFVTKEIREDGQRTGFEIVTSTGERRLLSSTHMDSSIKVSRYFVDVSGFNKILPPFFNFDDELLYIDEIGQMELYADKFQDLVRLYLDAPNHFLGTFSRVYSHPLIDEIRERKDVTIFDLTPENREEMFRKIRTLVSSYKTLEFFRQNYIKNSPSIIN